MELTQDFEIGIIERIQRDPAFVRALLDEADEVLLGGEYTVTQELLRVLITGSVGFDILSSSSLSMTSEELKQALSPDGHPDTSILKAIASALRREFGMTAS